MESGIGVYVDVFATWRSANGGVVQRNLVADRLTTIESVCEDARLIKSEVATCKACGK
jgi:hypothetical protein